jgi:hypothetical protein
MPIRDPLAGRGPSARLRDSTSVLEDFTVETFSGRIGDRFRITGHTSIVVEAQLTEAQGLRSLGRARRHPLSSSD